MKLKKTFFSKTTGPILTKLGTQHPWVKGTKFYSNEGPCPISRGDNYEIAKNTLKKLKIFFSLTTGPISTNLGTMCPLVKGIQICSNEGPCPYPRGNNYEIAKKH